MYEWLSHDLVYAKAEACLHMLRRIIILCMMQYNKIVYIYMYILLNIL